MAVRESDSHQAKKPFFKPRRPGSLGLRGSHVGIWLRGFATSLFGLVLESAGICRTFVIWSQDWGLCLKAPFS